MWSGGRDLSRFETKGATRDICPGATILKAEPPQQSGVERARRCETPRRLPSGRSPQSSSDRVTTIARTSASAIRCTCFPRLLLGARIGLAVRTCSLRGAVDRLFNQNTGLGHLFSHTRCGVWRPA